MKTQLGHDFILKSTAFGYIAITKGNYILNVDKYLFSVNMLNGYMVDRLSRLSKPIKYDGLPAVIYAYGSRGTENKYLNVTEVEQVGPLVNQQGPLAEVAYISRALPGDVAF